MSKRLNIAKASIKIGNMTVIYALIFTYPKKFRKAELGRPVICK